MLSLYMKKEFRLELFSSYIDATGFDSRLPARSALLAAREVSTGHPRPATLVPPQRCVRDAEVTATVKSGEQITKKDIQYGCPFLLSMRQDLNLRPLRPERSALPN